MVSEILLILYLIFAVFVGVKLYGKTNSWLSELDRITPPIVETGKALKYGFLAFGGAAVLELLVLYPISSDAGLLFLPLVAGFVEEGAKLSPYLRGGDELYRWRLTVKVALIFAVIEAVLYGITLFFSGNILGALLRIVVVMYHVSFTAIALEDALKGSLLSGYLKAALLHTLYDAPPVFVTLAISDLSPPLASIMGIAAIVYTYYHVDEAFGVAHRMARRALEERKKKAQEFWNERGGISFSEDDGMEFTSSP
ncbi:protease PrsW [Thermococcus peptonophilus]|uniref:protease PrsW n=1 Tax=Thermococcus peptonophilus TaxID=53952 RepID=UPI0006D011D7